MKIYVITHKPFLEYTENSMYIPLLVGADYNNGLDFYEKDNSESDNISSKNPTFCELTGQYWIWKHSDEDIVGLCHYRRYFTKNSKLFSKTMILNGANVRKILSNYDVILPKKRVFSKDKLSSKDFFNKYHDENVWRLCKEIIADKYPEYLPSFKWFENENEGYCYNMLVSNKELFDSYSSWMFDILFELEEKIDFSKYDDYNKRMIGFVSERLINVWVHRNKLRVKEIPVVFTESESNLKKIVRSL